MATSATNVVRPARPGDPEAIAAVQARAWTLAYGNLLPEATVAALSAPALLPAWQEVVRNPPSARHAVLVAVADDIVVGFASVGPSPDPDAGPDEGQLAVLAIDPAHQRSGHASRLLSAVVEHLRTHGMNALTAWIPEADLARTTFLTTAGMVADGAKRSFAGAGGNPVTEIRLSAAIGEPEDHD